MFLRITKTRSPGPARTPFRSEVIPGNAATDPPHRVGGLQMNTGLLYAGASSSAFEKMDSTALVFSSLPSGNGEEGPSHDGASARRSKTSNPRGMDVTAEFFEHLLIQEAQEDLPKISKLAKECSEHFGGTALHGDKLPEILSLARMVPYGDRIRLTTSLHVCLNSYYPLFLQNKRVLTKKQLEELLKVTKRAHQQMIEFVRELEESVDELRGKVNGIKFLSSWLSAMSKKKRPILNPKHDDFCAVPERKAISELLRLKELISKFQQPSWKVLKIPTDLIGPLGPKSFLVKGLDEQVKTLSGDLERSRSYIGELELVSQVLGGALKGHRVETRDGGRMTTFIFNTYQFHWQGKKKELTKKEKRVVRKHREKMAKAGLVKFQVRRNADFTRNFEHGDGLLPWNSLYGEPNFKVLEGETSVEIRFVRNLDKMSGKNIAEYAQKGSVFSGTVSADGILSVSNIHKEVGSLFRKAAQSRDRFVPDQPDRYDISESESDSEEKKSPVEEDVSDCERPWWMDSDDEDTKEDSNEDLNRDFGHGLHSGVWESDDETDDESEEETEEMDEELVAIWEACALGEEEVVEEVKEKELSAKDKARLWNESHHRKGHHERKVAGSYKMSGRESSSTEKSGKRTGTKKTHDPKDVARKVRSQALAKKSAARMCRRG